MRRIAARLPQQRLRQRGQVFLITLVILSIGFGLAFYTFVGVTSSTAERDKITTAALAQAKEALIGYAVSQTTQPGVLPCPDIDNDGSADSPCGVVGVTAIGRLPWKTLGLPDLRDGSGECLWYAVSANFKNSGVSGPSIVNSDSVGTLVVNDGTGTPLPSPPNPAIAVVFGPGSMLSGQDRTPTSPATVCRGNNSAANYLEGGNESGGTTFVTTTSSVTFNDRLLPISNADVITPVEQRAAKEILNILAAYRSGSGCNCYPWADSNWNGMANSGTRYGNIPLVSASPENWSSAAGYNPSAWLTTNQWYKVIYYAVSNRDRNNGQWWYSRFSVDSTSNVRVVLITTGPAVSGDNRPSSNWTDYVNDSENRDNDDTFISPTSTAYARDRIYWLTSP